MFFSCFSILASQLNSDLLKSDPDLSNEQGYIKRHSDVLSRIFLLCVSCFQMHLPMPVVQVIPWLWWSVCVGSDSVEENILLIPNQSKLYTSTSSVTHQKVDRHTWIYFFFSDLLDYLRWCKVYLVWPDDLPVTASYFHTVDGRNPAPLDSYIYTVHPIIYGFFTSQLVVWDFFHQHYHSNFSLLQKHPGRCWFQ